MSILCGQFHVDASSQFVVCSNTRIFACIWGHGSYGFKSVLRRSRHNTAHQFREVHRISCERYFIFYCTFLLGMWPVFSFVLWGVCPLLYSSKLCRLIILLTIVKVAEGDREGHSCNSILWGEGHFQIF